VRLLAATGAGMVTVTRRICCEVAVLHLTVILVLRVAEKDIVFNASNAVAKSVKHSISPGY
jgi:hypothetical protein